MARNRSIRQQLSPISPNRNRSLEMLRRLKPANRLRKAKTPYRGLAESTSRLLGLKYFRLPPQYPSHLATLAMYTTDSGVVVPLLHREKVSSLLEALDARLQPLLRRFSLFYSALAELDPSSQQPAFTTRVNVRFSGPNAFVHYIQLKVRRTSEVNNPKRFYSFNSLLAVLLHEVAHTRFMDHEQEFRLLLRDLYKAAFELKLLQPQESLQLPSVRSWERQLFLKRGRLSPAELVD